MHCDVVMIVGKETDGEANWSRLHARVPTAIRVSGASTMRGAYARAAEAATSSHFFSVDGDNWLADGFGFEMDFAPAPEEVALWRALNPVNGLVYPHGGIKLLPTLKTRRMATSELVDVVHSVAASFRTVPVTASEHRFNTSPFDTWRTAFRECAKLASWFGTPVDKLYTRWLDAWCTKGAGAPFGDSCLLGAREGRAFGERWKRNPVLMQKLNDFSWLNRVFNREVDVTANTRAS